MIPFRRGLRAILTVSALVSSVAAGGGTAWAQRGVDVSLFHPSMDSYGIITVERAHTARQWQFGFKLFANYAHEPLRLAIDPTTNGGKLSTMIDRQVALDLVAHFGLTNWLELAMDVPFSAQSYNRAYGDYGSAADPLFKRSGFYLSDPYTNIAPPDAGPLDFRLALKARLFRVSGFGMALAGIVTFPFGDESAFLGDADFSFRPLAIADFTRGPFTVAANVGAAIRSETVVYDPSDVAAKKANPAILIDVGHELTWSAGAAYRFVRWVGLAAEVFGSLPLVVQPRASRDTVLDVVGGFQIFPNREVAINFGGGAGVIGSSLRHDAFRAYLGVTWALLDGQQSAGALDGTDSDGDGIPDSIDQCPHAAEDFDHFQDDDGCPELDNDGDGIPDKLDRCPNEPEDHDGFQDADGCPDYDDDLDGIPDVQDKCPHDPEDRDGFQDEDGCPDLDNDGDGVPDAIDTCPNEPETFNGLDDKDGCPDSGGVAGAGSGKVDLSDIVTFDAGKPSLPKRADPTLERIADRLKANPSVRRVRIEGHTDGLEAKGRRAQDLSQLRAELVREFLIGKGVELERLQAVGYGDARPAEKRNTAEARAKNRRVEFIVVE